MVVSFFASYAIIVVVKVLMKECMLGLLLIMHLALLEVILWKQLGLLNLVVLLLRYNYIVAVIQFYFVGSKLFIL